MILLVGDSLSAAYGIALEQGWAQLLQARLVAEGRPHRVVNASISGETTAGGLARLPELLGRHRPAIVLVELGGNDGLRGLALAELEGNLAALARQSRAAGAHAVLFEMRIPPNYGKTYTERYTAAFASVAQREQAALVPFWLADIATDPASFQADGIHPTAAVQGRMLDAVWPTLEPLLK